jgi:outer membrane protein assembly factor BamB
MSLQHLGSALRSFIATPSRSYPLGWVALPLLLLPLLSVAASPAGADDWPQWLGPRRDSRWRETGILKSIPAEGLRVKWRAPVSGGYAGPAVAGQRVFVMDYVTTGDQTPNPDQRSRLEGTERLLCLRADTGQQLWKYEYDCPYEISFPAGPRATPTVDGEHVYTLGAEGNLHCLDVASGAVVWSRDFKRDYGAKTPVWGFCGHPLVDGDKLICVVGGADSLVVAFDRRTGQEVWRSLNDEQTGYSAPVIIEAGGRRQLLIWHGAALSSLDPETGQAFWSQPLDPNYGMSIVTPRWSDNMLFVGGIVNKSMMLRLDSQRPAAEVLWYGSKDVGIDPVHSTPLAEDGILYGVTREGQLSAVQMSDGHVLWSNYDLMPERRRVHSGTVFMVKNEDRFFLMNDSGELIAARLSKQGYEELGRAKILETTTDAMGRSVVWSHPAFAHGCVFARNDKEIVCVLLASADY